MEWEILHAALRLNYLLNREWLNWMLVIIDRGNERSNGSHLVIDSHFQKKITLLETKHDPSLRLLTKPLRKLIASWLALQLEDTKNYGNNALRYRTDICCYAVRFG